MEIDANICKNKNVYPSGYEKFQPSLSQKYSSDMTECSHRGGTGHVTDNLPTHFGDDISINKKVDILSPNITHRDFND